MSPPSKRSNARAASRSSARKTKRIASVQRNEIAAADKILREKLRLAPQSVRLAYARECLRRLQVFTDELETIDAEYRSSTAHIDHPLPNLDAQ